MSKLRVQRKSADYLGGGREARQRKRWRVVPKDLPSAEERHGVRSRRSPLGFARVAGDLRVSSIASTRQRAIGIHILDEVLRGERGGRRSEGPTRRVSSRNELPSLQIPTGREEFLDGQIPAWSRVVLGQIRRELPNLFCMGAFGLGMYLFAGAEPMGAAIDALVLMSLFSRRNGKAVPAPLGQVDSPPPPRLRPILPNLPETVDLLAMRQRLMTGPVLPVAELKRLPSDVFRNTDPVSPIFSGFGYSYYREGLDAQFYFLRQKLSELPRRYHIDELLDSPEFIERTSKYCDGDDAGQTTGVTYQPSNAELANTRLYLAYIDRLEEYVLALSIEQVHRELRTVHQLLVDLEGRDTLDPQTGFSSRPLVERYNKLAESVVLTNAWDRDALNRVREELRGIFAAILEFELKKQYPDSRLPTHDMPYEIHSPTREIAAWVFNLGLIDEGMDIANIRALIQTLGDFEQYLLAENSPLPLNLFDSSRSIRHFLLGSEPSADDFIRTVASNLEGYRTYLGRYAVMLFSRRGEFVSEIQDADGNGTGYYLVVSRGMHEFSNGLLVAFYRGNPIHYPLPIVSRTPLACVGLHFGADGVLRVVNIQGNNSNEAMDLARVFREWELLMDDREPNGAMSDFAKSLLAQDAQRNVYVKEHNERFSGESALSHLVIREELQEALGGLSPSDALLGISLVLAKAWGMRRFEVIRDQAQQARLDAVGTGRPVLSYDNLTRRWGIGGPKDADYVTLDLDKPSIYRGQTKAGQLRNPIVVDSIDEYLTYVLPRASQGKDADRRKWDKALPDPNHPRVRAFVGRVLPALPRLRLRPASKMDEAIYVDPDAHLIDQEDIDQALR